MIFLQLFWTFFKIGLFGFGGGYGMLSLIQMETVHNHHWLTSAEFTNIVAISQMTPGPIGINSATYCGSTAISKMFMKYMKTRTVQHVFTGLRPAVVGLLASATIMLLDKENFSAPSVNLWQFIISVLLFAATFVGTMWIKINPIRMICYAAIAGLVLLY